MTLGPSISAVCPRWNLKVPSRLRHETKYVLSDVFHAGKERRERFQAYEVDRQTDKPNSVLSAASAQWPPAWVR